MAYERTASGGKREKIPKYGTDKYRSSEHITPLHSDLSGGDYTYKNKKRLRYSTNPQNQALTEVSI